MNMEKIIYKISESNDINRKGKICIVGVGGAGNNSINRIYSLGNGKFFTVAINTDFSHLESIRADVKILLKAGRGMGTGGDVSLGERAVFSAREEILKILRGFDLIFIISGFGGGTGTGATPEITRMAISTGAVVINVVTLPFRSEGSRYKKALDGIKVLTNVSKTIIVLDNNKLLISPKSLPAEKAFFVMDQLVYLIVDSFYNLMTKPSILHVGFSEVKHLISTGKISTVLYNEGKMDNVEDVIDEMVQNPLMDVNISNSTKAILYMVMGEEPTLEFVMQRVVGRFSSYLMENENITPGIFVDPSLGDRIRVMAIITNVLIPSIEEKREERKYLFNK